MLQQIIDKSLEDKNILKVMAMLNVAAREYKKPYYMLTQEEKETCESIAQDIVTL